MYDGLQEYVEDAAKFYREQGNPKTAESLLDETNYRKVVRKRRRRGIR